MSRTGWFFNGFREPAESMCSRSEEVRICPEAGWPLIISLSLMYYRAGFYER